MAIVETSTDFEKRDEYQRRVTHPLQRLRLRDA